MVERRWWRIDEDGDVAAAVWSAYDAVRKNDEGRRDAYARLRALYETGIGGVHDEGVGDDSGESVSKDNIVGSILDTAAAKLLESRPDPMILTSGGDVALQRQADQLSDWTSAAARDIGLHDKMEAAWMEAEQVGTGAVRVYERDGEPAVEVAFCEDIFVDAIEAHHDAVMTYYQDRTIDRSVLAEHYPEHREAIGQASAADTADVEHAMAALDSDGSTADMVSVVQAWRVAASRAVPGKFVVVLHSKTGGDLLLHSEEYPSRKAPFVFMHYKKRSRRFWGMGLAIMLAPIQAEIDDLAEIVDGTLESFIPSAWLQEGSTKVKEQSDETGMHYTYSGEKPYFFDPSGAAAQGQRSRENERIQRGYHMAGVSAMESGAQKESGLNSGRAILAAGDARSQRLLRQHRSIEDAYEDAFSRIIDVADAITEGETQAGKSAPEHQQKARMAYLAGKGDDLRELPYTEARISEAMFRCTVWPISKLSKSPQGRMQEVGELANMGSLEPDEVLELLDFPDVKAVTEARNAVPRWARRLVEMALTDGPMADEVSPMDDLGTIISFGTVMHAKARLKGTDLEALQDLRDLVTRAESLQQQAIEAAQPPAPPMAPPGMPPEMPPGPPMPPGGGPPPLTAV